MKRFFLATLVLISLSMVNPVVGQDGPTPKAPPEDVRLPIVDLVYEADFSNINEWPEGDNGQMSYVRTDESYALSSVDPEAGIGAGPPILLDIDDFYTEMIFTVDSCSTGESALLFFTRVTPGVTDFGSLDSFVFVIQCNGDFRARTVNLGTPGPLAISGQTLTLDEGQEYAMGVLFSGNSVLWYLNGQEVGQLEVGEDVRTSGTLTMGAQRGIGYTVTDLYVWSLKSTGSNMEEDAPPSTVTTDASSAGDPLAAGEVGDIIYQPSFSPPTTIPLGLHHPIATYISGDLIAMYNNVPFGILPFEGIDQEDYYLEVSFGVRDCSDTSSIGFVWRASEDFSSYYAYQVQCDGGFIAYVVENGEASDPLAAGTINPSLRDINDEISLGVYVRGTQAWLYLQNQVLASFEDSTFTTGRVGLVLASGEDDVKMDILATDLIAFIAVE